MNVRTFDANDGHVAVPFGILQKLLSSTVVMQTTTNSRNRARRVVFGVRFAEALRDVLDGIGAYVKQYERNWIIECVDADEFVKTLQPGEASGAITIISPASKRVLKQVLKSDVPTINLFHNCHPKLPSVLSDDPQIGADAAQYLLRLGFRNFGYVGINTGWKS